jgi:hypothetical protein
MSADPRLAALLEHPAIWRGRSAAHTSVISTGYPSLDEQLPGGGWPRAGLIEILTPEPGSGELRLLLPALASLTRSHLARWSLLIAPPFEPFAPALRAAGIALERLLIAQTDNPLWAMELALRSAACEMALAWIQRGAPRLLRRLQLASEQGRALGVLLRGARSARESSPAMLRLALEPTPNGVRLTLLKSRGGARGSFDITWLCDE